LPRVKLLLLLPVSLSLLLAYLLASLRPLSPLACPVLQASLACLLPLRLLPYLLLRLPLLLPLLPPRQLS
jgi:hypothetical protein